MADGAPGFAKIKIEIREKWRSRELDPSIRMWITIAFVGTAAVFIGLTFATLHHQRWAQRLPALEALPVPAGGSSINEVRCSVIVAARDEEARLEATVRHLLAQRHVALEVIVVDDRSTDATDDILRRLASEDTRVRATRVEHLPEGWLGKSLRMSCGRQCSPRATGCYSPMPTAG